MIQALIFLLSVLLWLFPSSTQQQHQQHDISEYTCLLAVLFHEARGEPIEGIRAVASVVINRKNHPSLYPRTICGVVLQRKQFSNVEHTYNKALNSPRSIQNDLGYTNVARVSYEALYKDLNLPKQPLFYHTKAVNPSWRYKLKKLRVIGAHVFYGEDKK